MRDADGSEWDKAAERALANKFDEITKNERVDMVAWIATMFLARVLLEAESPLAAKAVSYMTIDRVMKCELSGERPQRASHANSVPAAPTRH